MTIDPTSKVVATLISTWEDDDMTHRIVEGKAFTFFENEHAYYITEAQLLTMNSFVRKRWKKALEGTKVPYTMQPSPPPTDQTF